MALQARERVPDVTAAIAVDGRRQRSADSRQRILSAMRALIQEGKPDPAAEDVAQRAGVGLRTVFRLFRDMESVCAEMLIPQRQVFFACFTSPFTRPAGRARLHELFDRLAELYEANMPLRRAGSIRRYSSPSLAAAMLELDNAVAGFIRGQLTDTSPSYVYRLEMLTFLMSYDSWMRLRDQQALGPNETKALLDQAINAALA